MGKKFLEKSGKFDSQKKWEPCSKPETISQPLPFFYLQEIAELKRDIEASQEKKKEQIRKLEEKEMRREELKADST